MGLTTTKVFRWNDPGALKLDGTAGSFYLLIKHCLTTAGWSIEWDDPVNFKVALRNSQAHGGSGCYIRVDDNTKRVANWRVYEDMSGIDSGTGQCCNDYVWKAREVDGAYGANAVNRCYVIVADERTVYVSTWVGDDDDNPRGTNPTPDDVTGVSMVYNVCTAHGGDFDPFIPGDPGVWGSGMTSSNPGTALTDYVMSYLGSQIGNDLSVNPYTTVKTSRNAALTATATKCGLYAGWQFNNEYGIGSPYGAPMRSSDPFTAVPAFVHDGTTLRGRARGLFAPLNDMTVAGNAQLGVMRTPMFNGETLSLVTLAGTIYYWVGHVVRLYAETSKSWDDI